MIRKLDHFVITSRNPKECIKFYIAIGFVLNTIINKYELFSHDFKINVHEYNNELQHHATHVKPGSGDFCFEISGDLVQIQNKLVSEGFKSITGIVSRNGAKGSMQSIYYYDYDGNLVELCSYV